MSDFRNSSNHYASDLPPSYNSVQIEGQLSNLYSNVGNDHFQNATMTSIAISNHNHQQDNGLNNNHINAVNIAQNEAVLQQQEGGDENDINQELNDLKCVEGFALSANNGLKIGYCYFICVGIVTFLSSIMQAATSMGYVNRYITAAKYINFIKVPVLIHVGIRGLQSVKKKDATGINNTRCGILIAIFVFLTEIVLNYLAFMGIGHVFGEVISLFCAILMLKTTTRYIAILRQIPVNQL